MSTVVNNSGETNGVREYPWVGEHTGTIVLFSEPDTGVVIAETDPDEAHELGQYSDDWEENEFRPFTGEVNLEVLGGYVTPIESDDGEVA